jgi:flavin reductase (DIM6/NTAB) family NADH-FMN oxidoreductase RutF
MASSMRSIPRSAARHYDPGHLRRVFGAFPTGVTAVAALINDFPCGITASSFTSVSMNPALVSVCIARSSVTWSLLRQSPRLGVSILSADQAQAGRQLATRADDRFSGLSWRATIDGAVFLDAASGWLDTSIQRIVPAGDHDIAILAVHDLDADHEVRPLVFHASRFRNLEIPDA